MSKRQIVFSGVGGQGLVSCGKIMGAAAIIEGKNITMTSSYGSEARGTFTKSDLIISEEPIAFPQVEHEEIVMSLAQVAYDRYAAKLDGEAVMVYDSDEVRPDPACRAAQFGFPFTRIARSLGYAGAANLVAAGVIVKLTGVLAAASLEQALEEKYSGKEKVLATNLAAFRAGYDLV